MKSEKRADNKNILMILQSDYPPDIRLTKEIEALVHNNYQVYLLCNNKELQDKKEEIDGATVIRLNRLSIIPKSLRIAINLPLFFNPVWLCKILATVVRYKIDFIHVHDLPLALSGIIIAKLFRFPVVLDLHENYPAALQVWQKQGLINKIIRNPNMARTLEDICLRWADKIIVTVEEHKNLLLSRGVAESKIFIVSNTVQYDVYTNFPFDSFIENMYKDSYNLVYVGNFSPERELEIAIQALVYLKKRIANIKLLLVGDGKIKKQLQNLATEQSVADNVEFTGWVDFEKTSTFIHLADVCIIPQPSNPLIDNGVPHKLFQYMALSKPIVVSDARPLARIVRESQCGEIFKSHSPEDFADAVLRIYHSDKNYGENGRRAVVEKYNWQETSKELIRLYDEF